MPIEPKNAKAKNWPWDKRMDAAVKAVVLDDRPVAWTAREFGVDRSALTRRVKPERERWEKRLTAAQLALDAKAKGGEPVDFPDFHTWWKRYFGHTQCPDCGEAHEMPGFHHEIIKEVSDPTAKRVLVNLPPYHSKTTLVSVWGTIYELCKNPNHRTIIVSQTADFAKTILNAIKFFLTNDEFYEKAEANLIADYGPFYDDTQPWGAEKIYVAGRTTGEKDPSVLSIGFKGQIYGRRADRIVFDDIATSENQSNPDRVQQMVSWIDKEALSRIGKSGIAIWVGTRIMGGDVYGVLQMRQGYRVIRKSCILDDESEEVLWPEHFPYEQAIVHRTEMATADWQLVYQNVDAMGMYAAFPPEIVEQAKDPSRILGMFEPNWRLIGGVDPAGSTKNSGYTAITVMGIDVTTGHRYLVDQVAQKSMLAYQLKDTILAWSSQYPIYEWRVEANGLQSQLVQYDRELIQALALRGQRVVPHQTNRNKWDHQFGVESMAPLMAGMLFSIPWGSPDTIARLTPFIEELISFPLGVTTDRVMSTWFADLGCRQFIERSHLPMFDDRATKRWPARIKRRRRVVDFESRTVKPVPLHEQRPGHMTVGQMNHRRMTVGRANTPHAQVSEFEPVRTPFANVAKTIDEFGVVRDDDSEA